MNLDWFERRRNNSERIVMGSVQPIIKGRHKEKNSMDKKNVLIIDDNVMMQHILTILLQDEGFTVDSCSDGETALEVMNKESFKVYLVDYRLPEMMGDAVTIALRKRYPDAYIIGYSIEHREQDFLKAGADKFIIKENLIRELIPSIKDRDKLTAAPCSSPAPAQSNVP